MKSHDLDPFFPVTNCHTFLDPPSSVTCFKDGPLVLVYVNDFIIIFVLVSIKIRLSIGILNRLISQFTLLLIQ